MNKRNQWLSQSMEVPLDVDIPICDAHHHLWVYPESTYLPNDFLLDIKEGHNVKKTIYVECGMFYRDHGPSEFRCVGEVEHIHRLTAQFQTTETQIGAGIIGLADLRLGDGVAPVILQLQQASNRLRGIRFGTACDDDAMLHRSHTQPIPGLMNSSSFRRGLVRVAQAGLTFDAWMYFSQLSELVATASAVPELRIILNHLGGPVGIGTYSGHRAEVFELWRAHMKTLAMFPNIYVKLGGLTMTMAGFGWHKLPVPPSSTVLAEAMRPYIMTCIEFFTAERCMFESNFPMDRVSCSYTVLWNAFKRITQQFTAVERRALFHDNAVRVYSL